MPAASEGAATTAAPEGPTERLSLVRLAIVVLVVVAVVGAGVVSVRRAVAGVPPRARSWSVPYVDVTLTPTYQFQDPQTNPSRDVALAFVVADPTSPCRPSWGGHDTLDEAADRLELDRRIAQLRAAGGDAVVSFGGRDNQELAVACTDQSALTDAYRSVVERYDATMIDLDLEGDALSDPAAMQRRAAALSTVQQERRGAGKALDVWLTLPVAPSGLTEEGTAAVEATVDGGVDLLGVNVMTMNFATAQHPTQDMSSAAQAAVDATARQLRELYRRRGTRLDDAQAYARIGATPMIGQNDVDGEVFTVDDAQAFARFAQQRGLSRVSMWSLNRDQACGATFADVAVHSNTCSGVAQQPLAFAQVFAALPGRAPSASATDAIVVPDRSPSSDDPARSPYPVWRPTAQYPEGYKVVWHGSVYQAKWFNQGADPSIAAANPWETPWALIGPVGPDDVAPTITTVPAGTYASWSPTALYQRGDRVDFDGLPYEARWSTKGDAPSTLFPVGAESPWEPLFTVPGEPPGAG